MIEKYKLKKEKFYIYTRLGLVHKKNFDYYRAYTYYLKAFENCPNLFNNVEIIDIIIK